MKNSTYFRLFILSILSAFVLSAISLFCLIKISESAGSEHRNSFLLFLAQTVENHPDLALPEMPPRPPGPHPLPPMGGNWRPPMPPPPGMPPGPPPGGPELWVIADGGQVISGPKDKVFPGDWQELKKPTEIHEVLTNSSFFRLSERVSLIRLDRQEKIYLVSYDRKNFFRGPVFMTQGILTFATVAVALFFALSITFFYLRRKSVEASAVLLRLERGDLKARFQIHKFDQFAGLLVDFNRMADEIERLVHRLRGTETARRELLQELGHDLRTPLTSLSASFENLKFHYDKMTEADRRDVFAMVNGEIEYFKELLEKLMTIAELDEPHYKQSSDFFDVQEIIQQEIRTRQNLPTNKLSWTLETEALSSRAVIVFGDAHLLRRFFKNAFDNATRFAKSSVRVHIKEAGKRFEIRIEDDGPGLEQAVLASYGRRREQRRRREGQGLNFSLGLGSVIMKTIAELHDGEMKIENRVEDLVTKGAVLTVSLPKGTPP